MQIRNEKAFSDGRGPFGCAAGADRLRYGRQRGKQTLLLQQLKKADYG